jgi:hypothetical protein
VIFESFATGTAGAIIFGPIVAFLFILPLFYCLKDDFSSKVADDKPFNKYTDEEKMAALLEFSGQLLRVRDNDIVGLDEDGVLATLALELHEVSQNAVVPRIRPSNVESNSGKGNSMKSSKLLNPPIIEEEEEEDSDSESIDGKHFIQF